MDVICWENVVTKIAIEKTGAVIVNLNIHEQKDMLGVLASTGRMLKSGQSLSSGIKNRAHMDMFYQQLQPGNLRRLFPERIYAPRLPVQRHSELSRDQERPRSGAWQFEKLSGTGNDNRVTGLHEGEDEGRSPSF